jgi:hypothetical protein
MSFRSVHLSLVLFLLVWGLVSCASYHPPDVEDQSFRSHESTEGDDQLTVTAAVLTNEEAQNAFGVNLRSRWIQAVWLEVTNKDDTPYWLLFPSLDPDYYSANEVAYSFSATLSNRGYRTLAAYLREHAYRNPVRPDETRSGFVFVTLDMGSKEIDVQLLSLDRVEEFTFYLKVPGLRSRPIDDVLQEYPEKDIQYIDEDELRYALTYLPCCTTDAQGNGEGDPLNMIFIGNPDDLIPAFIRRGWRPTEETYWSSIWKTVGSFLFGSRYEYSPVSPLYVFGRAQDVALQKARESVHRRNHLRLWLTPLRYKGKAIWIGQISRDIGVRFTLKSGIGVTHKIDPAVDETRNAIAQDMLFSQGLKKLGFVRGVGQSTLENPNRNLTGDPYFTDGLRVVLLMDREQTLMRDVEFFRWDRPSEFEIQELD